MQQGLSSVNQQGPLGRSKYGKDTSFLGSRSCELPENIEQNTPLKYSTNKHSSSKLSHSIPYGSKVMLLRLY